mgnify:FL=1
MSSKITIIGAGSVGATIAYTLSQKSIASEIVLIDINKQKAEGEVMDIDQGTSFREPISIVAGDYPDAADSDIVIITSGIARKPGQTRIELTQTNVNIMKSITPEIVKVAPKALYIIVSNPCDIMTYAFAKISGLPERQILGSGTALDTARLRCRLSQHYGVSEKNIHAYVFGEHGDTSFVPWSRAFVAGATLDEFDKIVHEDQKDLQPLDREEVLEYVHTSGSTVIAKKGATFYAVAVSVCRLCSLLLAASDTIVSVSTMLHGEYGIEDVCLSTMASIGPNGVKRIVRVPLTEEETEKLHASANALKDVIAQIDL